MPASSERAHPHACHGPSRALVWGAMLVVFAAGFALGAAWWAWQTEDQFGAIIRNPDTAPKRLAELLRSELHLTAEQASEAESLAARHFDAIDVLRSEVHPRFRAEMESFESGIRRLLSPQQQTTFSTLLARWRERLPPPPRGATKNAAKPSSATGSAEGTAASAGTAER